MPAAKILLLLCLLSVTGSGCFPCYYDPWMPWGAPYAGCVDQGMGYGPPPGPFDRRQARDMRRWYRQQNRMARRMWDDDDWPRGAGPWGHPGGFGGYGGFDGCGCSCGMGGCGMGFDGGFAGDFGGGMMAGEFMGGDMMAMNGGMMMDGQMGGGFCPNCQQQGFASGMPMQLGMEGQFVNPYPMQSAAPGEFYNPNTLSPMPQPTPVPQPYHNAPAQTLPQQQQPIEQMQFLSPRAIPSAAIVR